MANKALVKGIAPADFGALLDAFFENLDPDSEYMAACQSGSSKRTNVQTRVKIMSEILDMSVPERKETQEAPLLEEPKKKRGRKPKS